MNIEVVDYDICCAVGQGLDALRASLRTHEAGLVKIHLEQANLETWIGKVPEIDSIDWLGSWQSRNNALALLGLNQGSLLRTIGELKRHYGAGRIGVAIGSSTSSIDRTEAAYADLDSFGAFKPEYLQSNVHNPHAPGLFVAHYTGLEGPAITVNTACSSSAKVFVTAARWLEIGLVDAVLVGGVDTLCLSVLCGFNSLQLLSPNPCRPFDKQRDGINLGEAGGFAVLQRAGEAIVTTGISLKGYGESSDAYHMSHPHPEGLGARLSMESALRRAGLVPADVDYLNLHGTSSLANDKIEGVVVSTLFPRSTFCSSTKALMGHTLGAAGITEAIIAMDVIATDLVPGSVNLNELDDELGLYIGSENLRKRCDYVMSNSFGFGGNNCSLLFGRV